MAKAARVGDPVGHTMAMPGLIAGLAVGLALAAVTVATCGAGAVIVGAALAGGAAGGALTGMHIGEAAMGPPTGNLITGSPNVFINGAPAAITVVSVAPCLKEYGAPMPVAQGAATILINNPRGVLVVDEDGRRALGHGHGGTVLFQAGRHRHHGGGRWRAIDEDIG
ncbi:MAG: hypothetical protein E6Q92_07505, partial [Burkholderiaceae bacterium]